MSAVFRRPFKGEDPEFDRFVQGFEYSNDNFNGEWPMSEDAHRPGVLNALWEEFSRIRDQEMNE